MPTAHFRDNLRMVLVIASKDIVEVFRSRTILMNFIFTIVIIVIVKLAPTLWKPGRIDITVYELSSSRRIADLERDADIRVFQTQSFQAFKELLDDGDAGSLGLVIPGSLGKIKVEGQKIQSHDYVNELGAEGWELVAVEQSFPGSGISDYILFFKRPVAG